MQDRDELFTTFVASGRRLSCAPHTSSPATTREAEDLLQTALAKTYLAWSRIDDIGAVEAYVRRVMVTTNVSWWRRLRGREVLVASAPEHGLARRRDRTRRRPRHHVAPPPRSAAVKQRTALVLRYWGGLSEAEIAHQMGCAPGTVKTHASRGLAALRSRIDAQTGD